MIAMRLPIGSKKTATFFTWSVLLLFCALILAGWWWLLEPTLGRTALVALAALAITLLAAFSARQIGELLERLLGHSRLAFAHMQPTRLGLPPTNHLTPLIFCVIFIKHRLKLQTNPRASALRIKMREMRTMPRVPITSDWSWSSCHGVRR